MAGKLCCRMHKNTKRAFSFIGVPVIFSDRVREDSILLVQGQR